MSYFLSFIYSLFLQFSLIFSFIFSFFISQIVSLLAEKENSNENINSNNNHYSGVTNNIEVFSVSSFGDLQSSGSLQIGENAFTVSKSGNTEIKNNLKIDKNLSLYGDLQIENGGIKIRNPEDPGSAYELSESGMSVISDMEKGTILSLSATARNGENNKFDGKIIFGKKT